MEIWTPVVGEMLGGEDRINQYRHDIHAVAIYRDTKNVCHVPYNLAPRITIFLMRENQAFAEITGAKIKELAYGLEIHVSTVYMDLMFMFNGCSQ